MKKLLFSGILCCFWLIGFGQGTTPPPPLSPGSYMDGEEILSHIYSMDMNYHDIAQYAKIYTDSFPNDADFAKQFGRWSGFWKSRVDASGDFDATYRNMMSVLDNFPVCGGDDADWSQAGPIINVQNSGIIVTVASPPGQPNIIYAGSNSGGLWKTENAGDGVNTTWTNITDYRGVPGLGVNDIIIHPTNPSILYIATGFNNNFIPQNYGSGVWISTNGGVTWDETGLTWDPLNTTLARDLLAFNKLVFHPNNPNIIFALSDKEIYTMERLINPNDGSTSGWIKTNISHSNRKGKYIDIEFVKTGTNTYDTYVSTTLKGQLLRSSNYSSPWAEINNIPSPPTAPIPHSDKINTIVIESALEDNSNSQSLYVYYLYIDNKGNNVSSDDHYIAPLYKYNPANAASPWTMLNNGLNDGQGGTNDGISSALRNWVQPEQTFNNFEVNPKDATVMYFPGKKLGKTNNEGIDIDLIEGGLSFDNSGIHADHRDLIINFINNNSYEIVIGNDGGVATAIPNTNTNYSYTNINGEGDVNSRLILSQCTDISIANNVVGTDRVILGGAIDNANYLSNSSSFLWENIGSVDGGQTAINESYGLAYIRINNLLGVYNINTASTSTTTPSGGEYKDFAEIKVNQNNPNLFHLAKDQYFSTYQLNSNNTINYNQQPVMNYDFSTLLNLSNPNNPPDVSCFESAPNGSDMLLAFNTGTWTGQFEPRLFKSNNSGGSWVAVPHFTVAIDGVNKNPIGFNHITDICYASDNDLVWASISGWGSYTWDNTDNSRVIHSTDGGDTWQDYSTGLTAAPVNAIIYQEGSEGVLFAATDVGVYRYNPTPGIEKWECFNQGFPVSLVNDLEISNCEQKIYASAYGRGIWESALPPLERCDITVNTIWDTDREVLATTVVKAGKRLTIKNCTVNMARGTSIIVEPGAELIIHNATLTNGCGEMWDGIIVKGDATASQYGSFPNNAQGKVILRNNAKVEYALDAIRVWDPIDGGGISKAGGIVQANSVTFLNNQRDIEFMKYENVNPTTGNYARNLSYFAKCTFELDDDYRGDDLDSRVTMWAVSGINFNGCTFKNINQTLQQTYQTAGIYSIDAGYDIDIHCNGAYAGPCPANKTVKSSFDNFYYGVRASSASGNKTISVEKSIFTGNVYGISIEEVDNAKILECDFNIGTGTGPGIGNFTNVGIAMNSCINYKIQENNFIGDGTYGLPYSGGVHILNSEGTENEVYKNTFTGLFTANSAKGDNREYGGATKPGLQYLCNTQSNNNYDIRVYDGLGIRYYQGRPENQVLQITSLGDGNTFTNNTNTFEYYVAQNCEPVWRFHNTGAAHIALNKTANVNQVQAQTENQCLSRLDELDENQLGGIGGRPTVIGRYYTNETAYNNTVYLYDNLIDGGNTQGLSNNIQFNWSNDAWQMRNELLAESPNLSEEVLLDAALTGTLPDALLMEVLLANPRSVRSPEFHEILLHDIPNPLPQYMVDLLPFATETVSVRASLEEQMTIYGQEKAEANQLMIGYHLRDSIVVLDSLQYWLEKDNTPKGHFALAEHYLSRGQYALAQNTLNNVAVEFENYTERRFEYYQAYQQLMTLKINILQSGRTWLDITESEKLQLQTIAYNTNADAAFQARSLLCFFFGECVEEPINIENTSTAPRIIKVDDAKLELTKSLTNLTVYPNPAINYVTFEYELPEYVENAIIVITTMTGKVIQQFDLKDIKGQVLWDTRQSQNGIYFYALKQGKNTLASGKVSILK